MMRSSYVINNYGSVFRGLILTHKPKLVVECGVLDGYSTMCIAHALRFNQEKRGISSEFFAYDIWDEYTYNHGDFDEVERMFERQKLKGYVNLIKSDAFTIADKYDSSSIDFLHMDISNDGNILLKTLDVWGNKMTLNGIIAFEGGTKERDEGWIKEYNKKPIKPELVNNPDVYKNWDFQVFSLFPGLTLLWRK